MRRLLGEAENLADGGVRSLHELSELTRVDVAQAERLEVG